MERAGNVHLMRASALSWAALLPTMSYSYDRDRGRQGPSGKLKLAADAGAYVGSSGATTQGLDDASLGAQVLIYARPKGGAFVGASLGDASMTTDEKANRELYGRSITATEIVRDGKVSVPNAAQPFMAALPEATKGN